MDRIITSRLILRNFEETDYDDLYEFLSQRKDDMFEAYPGITYENGREHLKYRVGSDEFYAIELKESVVVGNSEMTGDSGRSGGLKQENASHGKVIGNVYFGKRDFEAREIGYIINKNYQRKGYAKEAINAVIEQAFSNGVHRIFAECDPRNDCSWGLLESLNFQREAFFHQNVYFKKDAAGTPIWQDTYVYACVNPKG